jgi:hypothetical protein
MSSDLQDHRRKLTCLRGDCLTNFTELSSSWEAVSCSVTQEIPKILWNTTVRFCVHKSPPLIPILSHINPIHTNPSKLSKMDFNIIQTYLLVFLMVSFLLAFPSISYMHSASPHSCYLPWPSHPRWLDHSNYTWRRVHPMKLLIMQFSPISCC